MAHRTTRKRLRKADQLTTKLRTHRLVENGKCATHLRAQFGPRGVLTLERITSGNLANAVAIARLIFPYEIHAGSFLPEVAFKMAIKEQNPRFAYYLARHNKRIVGITGHDPTQDGQPEMWLGWFGVLPTERRKGYGLKILSATCEIISGFGISSLYLYSGDREEERAAHHFYVRNGFKQIGYGDVDGAPVLYFQRRLPFDGRRGKKQQTRRFP